LDDEKVCKANNTIQDEIHLEDNIETPPESQSVPLGS